MVMLMLLWVLAACDAMTPLTPTPPASGARVGFAIQADTPAPPTPTPYVLPSNFEPAVHCAGIALAPRLILHERGRVRDEENPTPLRLRSAPDTDTRENILTQIPVNGVFLVLKGPVCSARHHWYYVRYRNFEGWIAEGENTLYFVEPYLTG